MNLEAIDFTGDIQLSLEKNAGNQDHEEGLFTSEIWLEPLSKFAKATGVAISLYDKNLQRLCEITNTTPLTERLTRAGFWKPNGIGATTDLGAATRCAQSSKMDYTVELDLFAHLAVPLIISNEVIAILVIGWLPERFSDPVICNHLAKAISAPQMEVWQLVRMQQPISREKLEMHARMLETFALPLIRQRTIQLQERKRALRAKVVNTTGMQFTAATSEYQLCEILAGAVKNLISEAEVVMNLVKVADQQGPRSTYNSVENIKKPTEAGFRKHLTILVPAVHSGDLGAFEILMPDDGSTGEAVHDIKLMVNHFATALQKVHLIQALEAERSSLQRANIQLQHLHKLKDEFLVTVSHELRTPLNAILGWSQILREGSQSPEVIEQGMETIERNAKNQSNLIEDLLDVSRIISGKMTLEREDIEATAILKQSIQTVFPMIEARKQKLHLQISNDPLFFKGDATRITQIFWNILSNASKFTPVGGDISVILESAGHYFKFEVTDSGKGIDAEFLPHLFERFSQADGSHTRRHGGLGLGLAIVRHLVELHGGSVKATSRGENKGSTFTIFFPLNSTDSELDNAEKLTRTTHSIGKTNLPDLAGIKILLVDDEPDSLRLTRFVLEKSGASVEMAERAEQGYEILRDWHPDLLISDISMPGESGYELIQRIRYLSEANGGETPAVALTALASGEQRDFALNAGFQLHITKPFDPKLLIKSVLHLLRKSPNEDMLKH